MKQSQFTIFRRITILVFALITTLCLLFMGITYFSTMAYHEASTQRLNKDVAGHIAKFASPFDNDGINRRKADSVFYDAMVISPSAQVYFLDTAGRVIAFHAAEKDIRLWTLPLKNIKKLIDSKGEEYIKGPDPKDPSVQKIFSAAEVNIKTKKLGYIYVILGSNEHATKTLYNSYLGSLLSKAFGVIIAVSIIFSLIYIRRIQRSFNRLIDVLNKFQYGDFEARFESKEHDELAPLTQSFNKMADLLSYNINRLTRSEKERKDFVGTISHDLRTPLSIVKGYTETLLMKTASNELSAEQQDQYLRLVLQKITQVEKMVQQLFELSKMEAVEFKPNKEPFVVSEIVQEIVNIYQLIASEKKLSLQCTECRTHVWVNADISMMERVFQNLIDNAIKHTPENGIIQVSIVTDNDNLVFTIKNSTASIPGDIINWINDSNDESSFSGSRPAKVGLGLLIVKKILYLHQFNFSVVTDTTRGNQFTIVMPIIKHSTVYTVPSK
ncbi:MAG: HAMP domain-containing sensor histidine kinase [Ferruginibacter sp.]